MADREKVKKGLDLCLTGEPARCKDCPYDAECKEARGIGPSPLRRDALELLKEQEALPIVYQDNPYTGLPVAHCPKCGKFARQYNAVYEDETKFCPYCGQAVKWE